MTDAEFRTQKSRVTRAYRRWHRATGMANWIVSHSFYRDGTDGSGPSPREGYNTTARCQCAWDYCSVTFHWNLLSIADHSEQELDRIVRHEICHALVHEMRCWGPQEMDSEKCADAMQHEERVVSQLSFVLLWCAESGNKRQPTQKKKR